MNKTADLKSDVKEYCRGFGFEDVGVLSVDSLGDSAELSSGVEKILPGARSVVSFVRAFPKGALHLLKDAKAGFPYYTRMAGMGARMIDEMSLKLSMLLESNGFLAAPVFLCTPMESRAKFDLWGYVSQIDLAARSGVGWIGRNGLLISPKHGARCAIGTVITNAPLAADSPLSQRCPEGCYDCVEKCPSKALDGTGKVNRLTCTVTQATAPLSIVMGKYFPPKENMDMLVNVGAVDEHTWYRCNACVVNCPVGL